ncbi:hypothetical protein GF420_00235 [candidate division GN15 bacterium]|nr:hypothetical protein [candidate division GN15 bacterium]
MGQPGDGGLEEADSQWRDGTDLRRILRRTVGRPVFQKYLRFVRGVSVKRVGLIGVVLVTSSVITFIILELARLAGLLTNSYIGLITYLGFPALFIIGLILIPIGWRQRKKETGKSTRELLSERFAPEETRGGLFGSTVFKTVAIFTLANIVILGAASTRMLEFMDQPKFCGTACHSVMNPEWVTYQDSPHARVRCVDCHVGEGIDALIDSKLNGTWQMISVTFDLLERPIPTPVHQLRPARETCEQCHWPEKFYGSRLKTLVSYAKDSASTPAYTTLNMKIDAGRRGAQSGIHWHIAEENEVRYASVNDEREEMIWVDARQPDGSYKRYHNTNLVDPESVAKAEYDRVLDCIDCHNRATHIYEQPDKALDERIRLDRLDRSLPYLKRVALEAITNGYNDSVAAMAGIRNHVEGYYLRQFPEVSRTKSALIDSTIEVLQAVYNRNIHHEMNIEWGTYPSHIGHEGNDGGCFRCHNPNLEADDGTAISSDCTMCHSIIANEDRRAFKYLTPPDTADADYQMHRYLQQEFMRFMEEQTK